MHFVLLQSFTNYIDAHIIMGKLKEEGIEGWLKDENLVTTIPLWTNAVGGIKLMVPEDELQKAKQLLQIFVEDKKQVYCCPNCGSSDIEYVSSPRKAANWLSVIAGFFLFSYAMPVKIWHCFACNTEFDTPLEKEEKPKSDT